MDFDQPPVVRVSLDPERPLDPGAWPMTIPAVAQVLCATHSPVLAAMPGATILEVGDWGLRRTAWEELELVQHWRRYLDAPEQYLRHVLE